MSSETSVRRRLIPDEADNEAEIKNMTEEERAQVDSIIAANKSTFSLHTIFWMVAAWMVFDYSDFPNVIVNDARIHTTLLKVGAAFISVNLSVGVYLVVYLSYLRGKRDWTSHTHPALIPVATLLFCVGLCLCTAALWPVWGFLTMPILFTLFMGVVMLATLLPF